MLNRFCGLLLLACLASLAFSCGGRSTSGTDFSADNSLGSHSAAYEDDQAALDAAWQAILVNPGTPGVDYAPSVINVCFKVGATMPASFGGPNPVWTALASTAGNPMLRKDKSYEPLAGAIAGKYGLTLRTQVYMDDVPIASYAVPEGTDSAQVLAQINADFASALQWATYARIYKHCHMPTDSRYANSSSNPQTAAQYQEWGEHRIGCTEAWDITQGTASVLIGDVDTGVLYSHQDLASTVLDPQVAFPSAKTDIVHNDNIPEDDIGHGTFIAGILAGAENGIGMVGIAPLCKVIPIKINQGDGTAYDADMKAGALLAETLGASVVNLSWGGTSPDPVLKSMCDTIYNNGDLIIVAAGNEGDQGNPIEYPGHYSHAFTVGSTGEAEERSSFSNYGSAGDPWVKIAAPGQDLTSTGANGNDKYWGPSQGWGYGTSFSAPMVAACCALAWTVKPSLTNQQLWDKCVSLGVPTTGFGYSVPRIDLLALLRDLAGLTVDSASVPQLISSGTVQLTPVVQGGADRVECWFNGQLQQTKTAAPWTFDVDTSSVGFGEASVEFRGYSGTIQKSAYTKLAVDNSGATFPILEDFEGAGGSFIAYDAKVLSQGALDSLYDLPGGDVARTSFTSQGPGYWRFQSGNAFKNTSAMADISDGGSYGAYEIDTLISRKIAVPAVNPTMVFYHHYNLEKGGGNQGFDRGWVFITTDGGQTFTPATLKSGQPAWFSGLQASWWKAEIDLSDFAGQTVNIVFSLQSDAATVGQDTGQPAGWWIDAVTVANDYNESIPLISGVKLNGEVHTGVNVDDYSVFGQVPGKLEMDLEVVQPENVASVTYIVDCLPYGPFDPTKDLKVDVSGTAPWSVQVNLPAALANQLANLRVQYKDSNNVAGPELAVPVYIFNQPGDVNADGNVDQLDMDAFPAMVGLASGEPGFIPFYDTDLDGTVRENDAAGIGYYWGQ